MCIIVPIVRIAMSFKRGTLFDFNFTKHVVRERNTSRARELPDVTEITASFQRDIRKMLSLLQGARDREEDDANVEPTKEAVINSDCGTCTSDNGPASSNTSNGFELEDDPDHDQEGPAAAAVSAVAIAPRRQHSAMEKLDAVNKCRHLGSAEKASRETSPRIHPTLIRKWKVKCDEAIQQLQASNAAPMCSDPEEISKVQLNALESKRKTKCGRLRVPEEVEEAIFLRFSAHRAKGFPVDNILLASIAVAVYKSWTPILRTHFRASSKWIEKFKQKFGISRRRATTEAGGSHDDSVDAEEDKRAWQRIYLARLAYLATENGIPPSLCYHCDETGIELLPYSRYTLEMKGKKHVELTDLGDKRQATVLVGGSLSGNLLPPYIIFQGISTKAMEKQLEDDMKVAELDISSSECIVLDESVREEYIQDPDYIHPVVRGRSDAH